MPSPQDQSQSQVVGKVAYSGTPIGERKIVNLHQWGMFLPSSSKNPGSGLAVPAMDAAPDVQAKLMSTGSISLTKSAYQTPEVQNARLCRDQLLPAERRGAGDEGKPAYRGSRLALRPAEELCRGGRPGHAAPSQSVFKLENFPEYCDRGGDPEEEHLSAVLAGQMDPKQGLDQSVEEIYDEVPALAEFKP